MKPLIKKTPIKRVETKSTEAQRAAKHKQTKKVEKKDERINSQRKVKSVASSELQSVLKNNAVKEVLPTSEKREEVSNVEKGQTIKETKKGKAQERQNASKYKEDMPGELHAQTVGKRGPVLEQDSVMRETLETFIHEKILERPVHVKGFGAFGYFETIHSMSDYTKLSFLQQPGEQVPVAVRQRSARREHRIHRAMFEVSQRNFIRTMGFLILSLTTYLFFPFGMRFDFQKPLRLFCHRLKTI